MSSARPLGQSSWPNGRLLAGSVERRRARHFTSGTRAHEKLCEKRKSASNMDGHWTGRALESTFVLPSNNLLLSSAIPPPSIDYAIMFFWPLAPLASSSAARVSTVTVQNLPLSQPPILSAFCAWKRALRPCQSERAARCRGEEGRARAACVKFGRRLARKKEVCIECAGLRAPDGRRHSPCPNSETASIHSTKAILRSFTPSLSRSLARWPGCLFPDLAS